MDDERPITDDSATENPRLANRMEHTIYQRMDGSQKDSTDLNDFQAVGIYRNDSRQEVNILARDESWTTHGDFLATVDNPEELRPCRDGDLISSPAENGELTWAKFDTTTNEQGLETSCLRQVSVNESIDPSGTDVEEPLSAKPTTEPVVETLSEKTTEKHKL